MLMIIHSQDIVIDPDKITYISIINENDKFFIKLVFDNSAVIRIDCETEEKAIIAFKQMSKELGLIKE